MNQEIDNKKIDEIISLMKSLKEIKDEEMKKQDKKLDEFAKVNSLLTSIDRQKKNIEKLNESVRELIQPPPMLELSWINRKIPCKFTEEIFADKAIGETRKRTITHDRLVASVANNGLGIGKNNQLCIIYPTEMHEIELFPISIKVLKSLKFGHCSTQHKEDESAFEPISPLIGQFFDIRSSYNTIKIDKDIIHAGDSVNYVLYLRLKDDKKSNDIKFYAGAYCLSENSQNRYFGIEIKISDFNNKNKSARLSVIVKERQNGARIPIGIVSDIFSD
jgi:hypothetical protein